MALDASLKVMQLVGERDGRKGSPASVIFTSEEVQCLKELNTRYEGRTENQKNSFKEDSPAWAAWIFARLGGWKGSRKASPPGPVTMKRGLDRFFDIFEG